MLVIKAGLRVARTMSDYVEVDETGYENLQYAKIRFEMAEVGVDLNLAEQLVIERKNALGVANVLRCLFEHNPNLRTRAVYEHLVVCQNHAQYIAFCMADFSYRRRPFLSQHLDVLLKHHQHAQAIYQTQRCLISAFGCYSEDYAQAIESLYLLLSNTETSSSVPGMLEDFVECLKTQSRELYIRRLTDVLATQGIEIGNSDELSALSIFKLAAICELVDRMSAANALTPEGYKTVIMHVNEAPRLSAMLQYNTKDTPIWQELIALLQQGWEKTKDVFRGLLNALEARVEVHQTVVPIQGFIQSQNGFFSTLLDRTPADPYGPGAIVVYQPKR